MNGKFLKTYRFFASIALCGAAVFYAAAFNACDRYSLDLKDPYEEEEWGNQVTPNPEPAVTIELREEGEPMVHVGALHTPEDFSRIKAKIQAGEEPWVSGWNKLLANKHADNSDTTNWNRERDARTKIIRGGDGENYQCAYWAAAGAYQKALRWKISGNTDYAAMAIEILNKWAATCTEVTGDTNYALAAGLYGYQFAVAGELLRDYSQWQRQDFKKFQEWMVDVFYSKNKYYLDSHHGTCDDHYWANWDLCNLASVLAIGIVADRRDIYNYGVNYLLNGNGNGKWTKAINYIHTLENGEVLGQIQESGRDQGHATLCVGLMGIICQLAWNQGDDFFGYLGNRFLAGCEYEAKYNIALSDVPFHEYVRQWGPKDNPNQPETHTAVSSSARGTNRPMWALPYYHYTAIKHLNVSKLTYTKMGLDSMPTEGGGGSDGGSSGSYDLLGYGTLLYTQ